MKRMADALRVQFPQNKVLLDDAGKGIPSVMVYLPAFRMRDVLADGSAAFHPAFVKEGKVLDGIYVSKFQNIVIENLASSVPDADPATHVDYDTAVRLCAARGKGWHLMTAAEWGAIALWCRKNGTLPYGNNDFGRDVREQNIAARISYEDSTAGICRVATGSGPVTWSHNHRADGIWDLNGNVWEWIAGVRLVCGEVQFSADGAEHWFALDGRTGARLIPNGMGTTPNSIKLDMVGGRWIYTAASVTDTLAKPRFCDFADVTVDETVCDAVREYLIACALLPECDGEDIRGVSFYANNGAAERMLFRGGRWGQGMNAGVFKNCLDDPRTFSGHAVGFRSVYLPQ